MQNWDSSLQPANYENNWYGNIFPHIKTEPQATINSNDDGEPSSSSPSPLTTKQQQNQQRQRQQPPHPPSTSIMDHYLNIKNQHLQHQQQGIDMSSSLTPSPRTDSNEGQQFFDNNNRINHNNNNNNNSLLHQQLNQHPLGFNPLTPPGLPNAILPQINFHNHNDFTLESIQQQQQQQQRPSPSIGQLSHNQQDTITKLDNNNSLTPRNTPPIDITPPKSPKINGPTMMYNNSGNSEYLMIDKDQEILSNSSDIVDSDDDDTTIRMPIYNSHGKMKNYKCKSCGYMAITKIAFWQHTRSHMKPEKLLQCSKCPFVTELKHHLEYHIRKHKNLKPFQCNKCNYTCVNKSMLNSHLKSHSSVYQYRCTDCDYATKYCHSFKLHLRKYDHKPGLVLDEEGLPNPSIIIDVYGTRRGPKMKSGSGVGRVSKAKESKLAARLSMNQQQQQQHRQQQVISPIKSDIQTLVKNQTQQQQQPQQSSNIPNFLPTPLANMLQQQHNMSQFFPYWNLNLQMLAAQQQAVLAQLSPQMREAAIQSLNGNTNNINNNINTTNNGKELKNFNIEDDYDQNHNYNNNNNNNEDDDDDDDLDDRRSESSSAMDLSSQGTPTKLNSLSQNDQIINMKLNDEITTPTISSSSSSRRKGRVLKLDTLLSNKETSLSDNSLIKSSDEMDCTTTGTDKSNDNEPPTSSSSARIDNKDMNKDKQIVDTTKIESIDSNTNGSIGLNGNIEPTTTTATQNLNNNNNNNNNNNTPMSGIFECKYCDIYFKDAVLYTIHMGYHSCDDVFKCNMCGEKCDGPVGLFVHMARNAHS